MYCSQRNRTHNHVCIPTAEKSFRTALRTDLLQRILAALRELGGWTGKTMKSKKVALRLVIKCKEDVGLWKKYMQINRGGET